MMLMSGMKYIGRPTEMEIYDLYWLYYNYQSGKNINNLKKRPVLIIDRGRAISLTLEVTSHAPITDSNHWEYPIEKWQEAGLKKPCTIKFTESNIVGTSLPEYDYIGHLSDFDIENVEIMLRTMPQHIQDKNVLIKQLVQKKKI